MECARILAHNFLSQFDSLIDPWLRAAKALEEGAEEEAASAAVAVAAAGGASTCLFDRTVVDSVAIELLVAVDPSAQSATAVARRVGGAAEKANAKLDDTIVRLESLATCVAMVEEQLAANAGLDGTGAEKVRDAARAMREIGKLTKISGERKRMAFERLALLATTMEEMAGSGERGAEGGGGAIDVARELRRCVEGEIAAVKQCQLPSAALQEPLRALSRCAV